MTLVVAKVCGDVIGIECDSQITSLDETVKNENPFVYGALKTIIVSPYLAISFAGLVGNANENYVNDLFAGLWTIKSNGELNLETAIEACLVVHNNISEQLDFIVSSISEKPALYKIQAGEVSSGNTTYWIGNKDGYEIFQEHFHKLCRLSKSDEDVTLRALIDAFTKVIECTQIKDVGGFQIGVKCPDGYFEYSVRAELFSAKKTVIKPKEIKRLPAGEAEDGSFSTTYFVSENRDKPFVGVFFPQGNLGVFYAPEICSERFFYEGLSDVEFVQRIQEEHDVSLAGLILDKGLGRLTYTGKKPIQLEIKASINLAANDKE